MEEISGILKYGTHFKLTSQHKVQYVVQAVEGEAATEIDKNVQPYFEHNPTLSLIIISNLEQRCGILELESVLESFLGRGRGVSLLEE